MTVETPQNPVRETGVAEQAWDASEAKVLAGVPSAAGLARELVEDVLARCGMSCPLAVTVVSELVANAVAHTRSGVGGVFGGCVGVRVTAVPTLGRVVLQVSDEGTEQSVPEPQRVLWQSESGRGLALVHALSTQVSVTGGESGRTVTSVMAQAPRGGAR